MDQCSKRCATTSLENSIKFRKEKIRLPLSKMCIPAHGQVHMSKIGNHGHMGQMGKWSCCETTTRSIENAIELEYSINKPTFNDIWTCAPPAELTKVYVAHAVTNLGNCCRMRCYYFRNVADHPHVTIDVIPKAKFCYAKKKKNTIIIFSFHIWYVWKYWTHADIWNTIL